MIRHATFDGLGHWITGRRPGVHLNAGGVQQAHSLATRLSAIHCQAIYSSPMERAQETARAISQQLAMDFVVDNNLNEIDYGEWTGKTFEDLDDLPEWRQYNSNRDTAQIPGGERMTSLRERAAEAVERLRKTHQGVLILVSHADWIRAAAAHYTRTSLEAFQQFEVLPASVNVIQVEDWGAKVLRWNDTGDTLTFA
jgi:broad specificity phosphatase PhoE